MFYVNHTFFFFIILIILQNHFKSNNLTMCCNIALLILKTRLHRSRHHNRLTRLQLKAVEETGWFINQYEFDTPSLKAGGLISRFSTFKKKPWSVNFNSIRIALQFMLRNYTSCIISPSNSMHLCSLEDYQITKIYEY